MIYSRRQRILWWINWLALVISFCIIGFVMVAKATGYRYNRQVGQWQKTGMIIVTANPRDSIVEIDTIDYQLPDESRIANILPGTYRVQVVKQGYHPWETVVTVLPGFVVNFDDVTLFRQTPAEEVVTSEHEAILAEQDYVSEVQIIDGELLIGTQLVTRFSEPPHAAELLPEGRHIVYIRQNEVRVIETNGQHDQLLYMRTSDQPTALRLVDRDTIIFTDGPLTKALTIR